MKVCDKFWCLAFAYIVAISVAGRPAQADLADGLSPIDWNATNNRWEPVARPLVSSGLTMDIRRFAQIPDTVPGTRPRLNSLSYAPGVEGLFVVDEGLFGSNTPANGTIYHVSPDGSTVNTVLNVGAVRPLQHEGNFINQQGGVRAVAFHPDFNKVGSAGYGKLYTSVIEQKPASTAGLQYLGNSPSNANGEGVIAEWNATFDGGGSFTGIDTGSYRELFRVGYYTAQHPTRQIAFDPHAKPGDADYGQLYILQGDGTSSGTGQNMADALGKVLRINPLDPDGAGSARYSVPGTNVFFSDGNANTLDEIFTSGHRNPHNIAFARDAGGTRQIFVAEIGQTSVEEVNLITGDGGGNYGWRPREGTFVLGNPNEFLPLPGNEGANGYVFPVAQDAHIFPDTANAIVGGQAIQNGSELDGHYFFFDFSHTFWNGDPNAHPKPVMAIALDDAFNATLTGNPDQLTPVDPLSVDLVFDHDNDPNTPSVAYGSVWDILNDDAPGLDRTDVRFGQGPGGELYILNKRNGWIYQVTNSISAVPEPTAGWLLLLAITSWLAIRRRKRNSDL